ncbi:MAG: MFS transporter [Bdellovibrionota bacterium]
MHTTNDGFGKKNHLWSKINDWRPDDPSFWNAKTRKVANRNLLFSVVNLVTAFCVWLMWSGLVVYLKETRPDLSTQQFYWLTAIPMFSAGFLRIGYSFVIPNIMGGKSWTMVSSAIFIPFLLWTYLRIDNPTTSFFELSILALSCGLAGANFASSCANISYFYPKKFKGLALGINAAIGNLGVGLIQFLTPILVLTQFGVFSGEGTMLSTGSKVFLKNVPLALIIPAFVGVILSYFFMNNIHCVGNGIKSQLLVLKNRHTWFMSFLYTATFGSFIGFAAVFPILLSSEFPGSPSESWAFLGAVLSSLMRPLAHIICLKYDSVKLTNWSFLLMICGLMGAAFSLSSENLPGSFWIFLISYLGIFIGTGLGKGSTTHMIPEIFHSINKDQSLASRDTASVIGFTSSIATIGAFFMPQVYMLGITFFGGIKAALYFFVACYALCIFVNWLLYQRHYEENPLLSHIGKSLAAEASDEDKAVEDGKVA